jgi:spore coat protein U-like protein
MTTRCRDRMLASLAALAAAVAPAVLASGGNNCSVSAVTHAFGAYDALNTLDSTSNITATCTTGGGAANVPYQLALSAGPGSYASRRMTGPAATILAYNLYTNSARTTIWGDGTAGTSIVSTTMVVPVSGSASFIHTLYGRIPGSQNVRPGAYATTSNITVTVTW